MCEPFVLQKTGKTVEEHQDLTLKSSVALSPQTSAYVMPVLQGFSPKQYASHVRQYGELLEFGQWVGVGSVCQLNCNYDAIEDVYSRYYPREPIFCCMYID